MDRPPTYVPKSILKNDPFASIAAEQGFYMLPAWQPHLELLTHLSRFSQFILFVIGPDKVGKTTLMQRFSARFGDDTRVISVDATRITHPDALLSLLLNPGHTSEHQPQTSLTSKLQTVFNQLDKAIRNTLLIVDNAEQWPREILQVLFELVAMKSEGVHKFHATLFAHDSIYDTLNHPSLQMHIELQSHMIPLSPLTRDELKGYLLHKINQAGLTQALPFSAKQLEKLYQKSHACIGEVDILASQLWQDNLKTQQHALQNTWKQVALTKTALQQCLVKKMHCFFKSVTGGLKYPKKKSWHLVWVGATIFLLGMMLVFQDDINQLFNVSSSALVSSSEVLPSSIAEPPEVEALSSPIETVQQHVNPNGDAAGTPVSAVLPNLKMAPSEIATTMIQSNIKPSVKPLPERSLVIPPTPAREPKLAEVRLAEPPIDAVSINDQAQTESVTLPIEEKAREEPKVVHYAFRSVETGLLARDPQHYTLQLMGSRSEAKIQDFMKQHQWAETVWMVKTELQGQSWFVLLYGDFENKHQAVQARAQLPEAVKRAGPWPRLFAQIQQAMR